MNLGNVTKPPCEETKEKLATFIEQKMAAFLFV